MIELNVNKFTYRIITETSIYDFPRRMKNIDDVVSKLIKLIQGEYLEEISRRCVCYDVFADINASFDGICKQKHSDRLFMLKDLIGSNRWQISQPVTRETERQINALWASRIDMYRAVIKDSKPKPVKIDRKMCTQLSLF